MRRFLLFVLLGLMFFPALMDAQSYSVVVVETEDPPARTPATSYVGVNLGEATGILTLLCVGNVGSMEVTISQNGVTIENDVIAVSNGQSVIYNLSGYAIGEYLLTIETADGAITQYIIYVEDD